MEPEMSWPKIVISLVLMTLYMGLMLVGIVWILG